MIDIPETALLSEQALAEDWFNPDIAHFLY